MIVELPGPPALALHGGGAGQGAPILFLHGIGGNASNWSAELARFSGAHALDFRGYGASAPVGPDSFEDHVADALAALDHLGPAHLVGLSMGGRVALLIAARHRTRVRTLTLASTSAGAAPDPARVAAFLATRLAPLEAGAHPADIADALTDEIAGPNATPAQRLQLRTSFAALRREPYMATLRAATAFTDWPPFAAVTAPTLVLTGSEDRVAPSAHAHAMAAAIPGATLAVLEGAGHVANIEAPDAFAGALDRHFAAHA